MYTWIYDEEQEPGNCKIFVKELVLIVAKEFSNIVSVWNWIKSINKKCVNACVAKIMFLYFVQYKQLLMFVKVCFDLIDMWF